MHVIWSEWRDLTRTIPGARPVGAFDTLMRPNSLPAISDSQHPWRSPYGRIRYAHKSKTASCGFVNPC